MTNMTATFNSMVLNALLNPKSSNMMKICQLSGFISVFSLILLFLFTSFQLVRLFLLKIRTTFCLISVIFVMDFNNYCLPVVIVFLSFTFSRPMESWHQSFH